MDLVVVGGYELAAVEGVDFTLSAKRVIFDTDGDAGNRYKASFELTVMPMASMKTLKIMLDYTHPHVMNGGKGMHNTATFFILSQPAD